MDTGKILAYNQKKLREERGMSLGQLSKISGISKAMLSEIERGNCNPTVNTLFRLANGFGVPYTRLLEEVELNSSYISKEEAVVQSNEAGNYHTRCYFKCTENRNFELFFSELEKKSESTSLRHADCAQEYVYVIFGELEIQTPTDCHLLSSGDALMFDASVTHTYRNKSEEKATFLIVNYYP